MLSIVFRPRAEADILDIAHYTKSRHGQAQAKVYIIQLQRQIEFAAEFPGVGSEAPGLPPIYRKLRAGRHRVIYRYDAAVLTVVRILHEREDVPEETEEIG